MATVLPRTRFLVLMMLRSFPGHRLSGFFTAKLLNMREKKKKQQKVSHVALVSFHFAKGGRDIGLLKSKGR